MTPRDHRLANLRAIYEWERERAADANGPRGAKTAAYEAISSRLPGAGEGKASAVYLAQIIRGFKTTRDARERTPSETLCGYLEAAYSLPGGWMSKPHADPKAELQRHANEADRLLEELEGPSPGPPLSKLDSVVLERVLVRTRPSLSVRFSRLKPEQKQVVLTSVEAQIAAFESQNRPPRKRPAA